MTSTPCTTTSGADRGTQLLPPTFLKRSGLRNRTPAPPPFSSMNLTPAASTARRSLARASSDTRSPKGDSTRLTVGSERRALDASFVWDQPNRPRAARSCSMKIFSNPFGATDEPFWITTGTRNKHPKRLPEMRGEASKWRVQNRYGTARAGAISSTAQTHGSSRVTTCPPPPDAEGGARLIFTLVWTSLS